jgi:uncharacterized protein YndB with AHSA1/START domain
MENRTVTHGTFVIERSYPATPERVFAAFSDPTKKRRWYAESEGTELQEHKMDFRVGGNESTRRILGDDTPFRGVALTSQSNFQDIVPNRRIVFAYTMGLGDRRISANLATVEFLVTEKGTELVFTDQGAYFEGADGLQMRETGWRSLLERLAKELGG